MNNQHNALTKNKTFQKRIKDAVKYYIYIFAAIYTIKQTSNFTFKVKFRGR